MSVINNTHAKAHILLLSPQPLSFQPEYVFIYSIYPDQLTSGKAFRSGSTVLQNVLYCIKNSLIEA